MKSPNPILTVRNLSVTFPDANGGLHALDKVSFELCPQEFICVLGPSGSGKTTLLRVLAGLLTQYTGSLDFENGRQPRIGMVFQQANLMPWRTAIQNITLPLELQGIEPGRGPKARPGIDRSRRITRIRRVLAARPVRWDGPARGDRAGSRP